MELQRAAADEAVPDLLLGAGEESALVERRLREDVRGAHRRRIREITILVIDDRLRVEVEATVQRAVDGFELLALGGAGVASSQTSVAGCPGGSVGAASNSGRGVSFISVSICSFVSGPRRYDI